MGGPPYGARKSDRGERRHLAMQDCKLGNGNEVSLIQFLDSIRLRVAV